MVRDFAARRAVRYARERYAIAYRKIISEAPPHNRHELVNLLNLVNRVNLVNLVNP